MYNGWVSLQWCRERERERERGGGEEEERGTLSTFNGRRHSSEMKGLT